MSRFLVALVMVASLLPAGATLAVAAVTTPCDNLPDTPVPPDAIIGVDGLITQFLADVDGDGFRDVITGYSSGDPDPGLAEHHLHVELASGWGTDFRIDTFVGTADGALALPVRAVTMSDRRLIAVAVEGTLVGADFALFGFEDCTLAPVPLAAGGHPHIWDGVGPMHSEWFACQPDRVVMLELFRGLDEDGDVIEGVYVDGKNTVYRLAPDGFHPAGAIELGLPRTDQDLRRAFPNCAAFVGTFVDDNTSVFQGAIEWLAVERISEGCNPPSNDRFCPVDPVTRGQMSALLARALSLPPSIGLDRFRDDDGHVFENAIEKLAAAEITLGCNPPANDRFCPDRLVTRGEMAAFLARAFDLPGYDGPERFRDDDGHVFESAIERLARAGITLGCNPPANDLFCPDDHVTRGQMAAFLKRALELE